MYVCIVIGHTPALEQHRVAESLGSWAIGGGGEGKVRMLPTPVFVHQGCSIENRNQYTVVPPSAGKT